MLTPYAERRRWRIPARLYAWLTGGPKASQVAHRWLRSAELNSDKPICLFVTLVRNGMILPHSVDHARAWHDAGFSTVVIVVVDALGDPVDYPELSFADALLLRLNEGYDFGAWASAILALRDVIRSCPLLAIANDSVLGPSASFGRMVERVNDACADVVGLVESNEMARHFQSFVLFFKRAALQNKVFWTFWSSVRSGDRDYVIANYEIPLRGRFQAAGLKVAALYPVRHESQYNPSFITWRALLAEGFPFLKIELFRTPPWHVLLDGWRSDVERYGFDLRRLDRQLAALEEAGSVSWAFHRAQADHNDQQITL